jgi:hypothetical protein
VRSIVAAFARGSGHGLLHLGAVELGAELSPALAYWRAFARGFVGAACAAVNPLDPAVAVIPAADGARIEALALAVPPMLGGELVDGARLHALWAALGRALVERAAEHEGGAQGFFQAAHPVWCAAGRVCLHLAENKRDAERPIAFIATYARARDDRPELQVADQWQPAAQECRGVRQSRRRIVAARLRSGFQSRNVQRHRDFPRGLHCVGKKAGHRSESGNHSGRPPGRLRRVAVSVSSCAVPVCRYGRPPSSCFHFQQRNQQVSQRPRDRRATSAQSGQ